MNIEKQIAYWREGADKDMKLARTIVEQKYEEQGMFFAHLALEKMLKAHVCKQKQEMAPWLHNLLRLAEMAGLKLEKWQKEFLAELNSYNLEGRYPTANNERLKAEKAEEMLKKAEGIKTWLNERL